MGKHSLRKGHQVKFVIQRVSEASVKVNNEVVGQISNGLVVLVGISGEDTEEIADKYVNKLVKLRMFEDEHGKTNLSLADVKGSLLMVSQFTLYADCRKGNRPSFTMAGEPKEALRLFNYVVDKCKEQVSRVETGVFGADMKLSLVNDGPFTICLDL